ncbi:hypothetical protein PAXINDRAFT_15003 [Paxillus involutus ATCC 200175]|uniref:Uncharacterized protein n=1 Tax=Paxillus involutus ATCC 200175 TaxID=664439 RepID=A0A0C9TNZ1_PAXIN|nr:hypothetical protein PAXINDRAFT_15003 [Paxillus involutus ATCC 200175]
MDVNNDTTPELCSHQPVKAATDQADTTENGKKRSTHDFAINVNSLLDLDHADDEGVNSHGRSNRLQLKRLRRADETHTSMPSTYQARNICIDMLDEEYNLPANGCTIWQPRAPSSTLESGGDVRMDLGGHNGDAATPPPTTLHENIDDDGYFNDAHIQSIEDEPFATFATTKPWPEVQTGPSQARYSGQAP